MQGLLRALDAPRPAEGLAAFRILFGGLMVFAVTRFAAYGWIDELYLEPTTRFSYLGFDWVTATPPWGLYAHFAVMGASAFTLMLGAWTRLSALVFFLTFTYAELIDKTTYLNHYYLVSLLALLLVFVPAGATWSVDARRNGSQSVRVWSYALLRAQVAVVYVFAGIAKLNPDWLLRAEPLQTWLRAHADLPGVGALFAETWPAFAMSWAGAAYDLSIVPLLLWARTRPFAYAAAIAFHVSIWLLFPVGVFSWVMLVSATLFFSPDWPRKLPFDRARTETAPSAPLGRAGLALAGAYLLLQLLVPLRSHLYPGNVNWTEEGFRFAWRVMLVEKSGQVEYRIETETPRRSFVVYPRGELTPLQYKMMSTQPDMIHEHALRLARRYRARGYEGVSVYADSWAALNGRPSQRLIDPGVDLAVLQRGWRPARWIVPLDPDPADLGDPSFNDEPFSAAGSQAPEGSNRPAPAHLER